MTTKADKTRHPITEISEPMALAIDALVAGSTDAEAADEANVTRQTVNNWRNNHPGFIAALNSRRRSLEDERRDTIRSLDQLALTKIRHHIEEDENGTVALAYLKQRGLSNIDTSTTGPTDADRIIAARAEGIRKASGRDPLAYILDEDRYGQGAMSEDEALDLAAEAIAAEVDQ